MSQPSSPWVFDVSEADFNTRVVEVSKATPVVVDFWAPWCGPCRMLTPVLEKVVGESNGAVLLAKVNTDENPRLADAFQIEGIPTLVGIRDGQLVVRYSGVLPEEGVRQFLGRLLPTEAEHLVDQARKLEGTDPAGAEQLYREALKADSRLDEAGVGLARALIARDKGGDEVARLLENAPATGPLGEEVERLQGVLGLQELARGFGDEAAVRGQLTRSTDSAELRYRLGCVLAARGRYRDGLEELLAAGERDFNLLNTKVRDAMVKIFHVVGNQDPLANEFRGRLATLLY